jgi:hypothetical protein
MCDCLRTAIAPHTRADTPTGRVLIFLHGYLARAVTRLDTLFASWRAGTLRPARPGTTRTASRSPIRLPGGQMWLVKHVQPTAIGQEQLRILLEDTEFQTFLREVPRAARILRPICNAVGFKLPGTPRPRVRPRPPSPPPEPPKPGKYPRFSIRRYRPGKDTLFVPKPA